MIIYNIFIQGLNHSWPSNTKKAIIKLASQYIKYVKCNRVIEPINKNGFVVIMDSNSFIQMVKSKALQFENSFL